MRMYFPVLLAVELKEGGHLVWEDGTRVIHNPRMGAVQSASNEDIVEYLRAALDDITKHDDTIMWCVVAVLEGTAVPIDESEVK